MKPTEIIEFFRKIIIYPDIDLDADSFPTVADYLKTLPGVNGKSIPGDLISRAQVIFIALEMKGYISRMNISWIFPKQRFFPTIAFGLDYTYGSPDFEILGFSYTRQVFSNSVLPIVIRDFEGDYDIGTSFLVDYNNEDYLITAKHCVESKNYLYIPSQPIGPIFESIYIDSNPKKDIAVIKLVKNSINAKKFIFDTPNILDKVLTMGFPTIPGFSESIQIAETATISGYLKSTVGEITGKGDNYYIDSNSLLISARVKGGNSGGPVINEKGKIVGVISHEILNGSSSITEKLDELGYGVAQSSLDILEILENVILNETEKFTTIEFEAIEAGIRTN
jgi:serine protease Do